MKTIVDAAVTGVVFATIDKFAYGSAFDAQMGKRVLLSAGSELASESVAGFILPTIEDALPSIAAFEQSLLIPAVSGGVYAFGSGALGWDYKSFGARFLHQLGASSLASFATPSVVGMLGMDDAAGVAPGAVSAQNAAMNRIRAETLSRSKSPKFKMSL